MTWIKASILSAALILSLGSETFAGDGLGSFCQSIIEGARELRYTWRMKAAQGGRTAQRVLAPLAGISHLVWAKGRAEGQSVLTHPIKDEVRDMYLAFDERSYLGSMVRDYRDESFSVSPFLNYFNLSELRTIYEILKSRMPRPDLKLMSRQMIEVRDRIAALEKIKEAALKEYNEDSFERRSLYSNTAHAKEEEVGNPALDLRRTLTHTWRRTGTMSVPDWYFFRRGREDIVVEVDPEGTKFVEGHGARDDLSEEGRFRIKP